MSVCLSVSDLRPHRCTDLDQISYGLCNTNLLLTGLDFFHRARDMQKTTAMASVGRHSMQQHLR